MDMAVKGYRHMIGESLKNKIVKIALNTIDDTIGKKFPLVDKLTDLFQEQQVLEKKVKDLDLKTDAIEQYLKENDEQVSCCNKKNCC